MKAKDISDLYWFCQSVEYGGFATTSLQTHVSAATLSRAVSHLEETLGEKLIHRHAKQFQLTTAGSEYYQRFSPIFSQLNEQWMLLSNNQPTLTGKIIISCPEPFADYFLQQLAIEFMETHPGVSIQILFASDTDRFFDDQIDLAICTSPSNVPHLVQRRLFNSSPCLAASPEYLKQHGTPKAVEDLMQHHLLSSNTLQFWEFYHSGKTVRIPINAKYAINSLRLTVQAACAGTGICLVPKATLLPFVDSGQLEILLADAKPTAGDAYMVWADRKLVSARVNAFREMILERIETPSGFIRAITTQGE